ncbi:Signal peptidase complex subunit [Trachipleistophora hominis]|uniref:Signal peptidase complex subunit 3 n=1 Tax=Trachipleistophora hominis TaxID=72359 RepID=L7JVD5_TRAHO|nr:Signal peptidase complex subunit [Trachipleistophora hominis]
MHSVSSRIVALSSILFNATTILLFCICIFTYIADKRRAPCNLQIVSIQPVTTHNVGKNVVFNPQIDLREYFHLNVKQIFVYLRMHNKNNSEMVWSEIVKKNDSKRFYERLVNTYRFFDIADGAKIRFELRGCVFPYVGIVQDKLLGSVVTTVKRSGK